ncbi:regulatory signaling modulator protein AmpE [Candidatus Ichthyocystis hellenicum]|uniref:regulatory signaling modulator protein AmpE n=1 Tax=Candidatus Ichthyocystis hellenicum TaxID=1561003 RepID=UPI000B84859F|nr:hypothetical protein [Candidatus Ichthyocystis hellenicum]
MHSMLVLAALISFFCDRFLCLRWIFYSSSVSSFVVASLYRLLEAPLPLGLRLLSVSLLSSVFPGVVFFIAYYANLVLYLALLVFLYLLLIPFHAFISDYNCILSSSSNKASDKISPWVELCGSELLDENESDLNLTLTVGIIFERLVVAPLVWSIILGPLGGLLYFFSYKTKVFADSHNLGASLFDVYFEWLDWIPSRFLIFMMCLLTSFSHFFNRVTWGISPSVSNNSKKFLLSSLSLFQADLTNLLPDSGENPVDGVYPSARLIRRVYQGIVVVFAVLLIIQGTILF